ncbi:zinc ribbon domain-containing protein [Natronococcus wangiae]|uniref:zinc ribbon domain-containing protein n=1 Tax=Natronococcus wangiae TaxID=3068275 RepID=UPI00273F0A16|nr:zinc ribbon domain-containing protein [Natronococcus sp. AD5]
MYPHYMSLTCHACQHSEYRLHQGTFRCTNPDCWVSEYQADLNAAAKIAQRLYPWGQSLPRKTVGDDSLRSGGQWLAHQDTSSSGELPSEKRASDDNVSPISPVVGTGAARKTGDAHTSMKPQSRYSDIPPVVEAPAVNGGRGCHSPLSAVPSRDQSQSTPCDDRKPILISSSIPSVSSVLT